MLNVIAEQPLAAVAGGEFVELGGGVGAGGVAHCPRVDRRRDDESRVVGVGVAAATVVVLTSRRR